MEDALTALIVIGGIFVGLPWIVFHNITKWKTAATLTTDDEALLEELYSLAKRLDARMDTVERLVASDHPEYNPARLTADQENEDRPLRELDRLLARKERTLK